MANSKTTKFDLLANARDSLAHAVLHLSDTDDKSARKWKVAVREISHVIELLLKERLRQEHPALIWEKVDDFAALDARTVGAETAARRLNKICGILLPKNTKDTLQTCQKLRNRIEHFEFQLNEAEARGIVGRLLSFIFEFSKSHLKLDLEKEFRENRTWDTLIEIYEFRQAQSVAIQKRLSEQEIPSRDCPSCGEDTFTLENEECQLCGHRESLIECDSCHGLCFDSEMESFSGFGDDNERVICKQCIEDSDRGDQLYHEWKDSQLDR